MLHPLILLSILCSVSCFGFISSFKNLAGRLIPSIGTQSQSPICYKKEKLGCFEPFHFHQNGTLGSLLFAHPMPPKDVGVSFHVYSCKSRFRPQIFNDSASPAELRRSKYDPTKKTIFLIHGYRDLFNEYNWNGDMKDYILHTQNRVEHGCEFNVVGVDWSKGSMLSLYHHSAANTVMVGAIVAKFIESLHKTFKQPIDRFSLVGHSLGSHISSFAGKYVQERTKKKVRFILGLDPAGPGFHNFPKRRLAPSDAELVVTIHTNAADHLTPDTFGIQASLGHYSFFPNGGKVQPGCEGGPSNVFRSILRSDHSVVTGLTDHIACSHRRATQLVQYNEALVTTSEPMAFQCPNYKDFVDGKCTSCRNDIECVPFRSWFKYWINYKLDKAWKKPRVYFIDTTSKPPFVAYLYGLSVRTGDFKYHLNGQVNLVINGENRDSEKIVLLQANHFIKPNTTYSKLVKVHKDLGRIEALHVYLVPHRAFFHKMPKDSPDMDVNFKQFNITFMSSSSAEFRMNESRTFNDMPPKFYLNKVNIIRY